MRWSSRRAGLRMPSLSIKAGLDAIRDLYGEERVYTFWHYMRQRWERNAGLRLDHLLLSPQLAKTLVEGGVDHRVRGLQGASDHAPVWIMLKRS